MMQRIGNRIYENSRSGKLTIKGFPEFDPVLGALRSSSVQDRNKSYRVSAQQHDCLMILEVYAKKWLQTESTRQRAETIIREHNETYNTTETFWIAERSGPYHMYIYLHNTGPKFLKFSTGWYNKKS